MYPTEISTRVSSNQFHQTSSAHSKFPKVPITTHCGDMCLNVVTLHKFWHLFDNSLLGSISNQSYFKTLIQEGDVDMATFKFPAIGVLLCQHHPRFHGNGTTRVQLISRSENFFFAS